MVQRRTLLYLLPNSSRGKHTLPRVGVIFKYPSSSQQTSHFTDIANFQMGTNDVLGVFNHLLKSSCQFVMFPGRKLFYCSSVKKKKKKTLRRTWHRNLTFSGVRAFSFYLDGMSCAMMAMMTGSLDSKETWTVHLLHLCSTDVESLPPFFSAPLFVFTVQIQERCQSSISLQGGKQAYLTKCQTISPNTFSSCYSNYLVLANTFFYRFTQISCRLRLQWCHMLT